MADDKIVVNLKCLKCGGIPVIEDNPTDDSVVKCQSCGKIFGTYGDIKAKAISAAANTARSHAVTWLKGIFKKR